MIDIEDMNAYLDKVKSLKGTKVRMKNPVLRALYEEKSITADKWLTVDEFKVLL